MKGISSLQYTSLRCLTLQKSHQLSPKLIHNIPWYAMTSNRQRDSSCYRKERKRPIACQNCRNVKLKAGCLSPLFDMLLQILQCKPRGEGLSCERCVSNGLECKGPEPTPQFKMKREQKDAMRIQKQTGRQHPSSRHDMTHRTGSAVGDFNAFVSKDFQKLPSPNLPPGLQQYQPDTQVRYGKLC